MWEKKNNRVSKHSFPTSMERVDIVRGTAAADDVGVRNKLAATSFGKFTRRARGHRRNPEHKFCVALIRCKRT